MGAALARNVTRDAFTGMLAVVIPLPAGGFIVGLAERQLLQAEAGVLADGLESAVRREYGPTLAPYIAAGLVVAAFVFLFLTFREGGVSA